MAGSPYVIEYNAAFSLPCPPAEVGSAMGQFERYESWWGWLKQFRVEGFGLETGSVLHGVVQPAVPYRLAVRIELLECVRPQRIEAGVHGDLEGGARMQLEPEGEGARASVSSTIEVMQLPMRLAARVAPRLLGWAHDRVVDATVTSFRLRLRETTGSPD